MSGKINFGCDFLHLMRILIEAGEENDTSTSNLDSYHNSLAAIKLFLILWGFSIAEVNESYALFIERLQSTSLDDLDIVAQRIVDHVSNDNEAKKRLVVQMAAIGLFDRHLTENEDFTLQDIQRQLDLRPSEFTELTNQGDNLAIVLNYFGNEYVKADPQIFL